MNTVPIIDSNEEIKTIVLVTQCFTSASTLSFLVRFIEGCELIIHSNSGIINFQKLIMQYNPSVIALDNSLFLECPIGCLQSEKKIIFSFGNHQSVNRDSQCLFNRKDVLYACNVEQIASFFITQIIAGKNTELSIPSNLNSSSINSLLFYDITEREKEILADLVSGYSYKQIACRNSISIETVKSHVRSIYKKLGVNNVAGAVAKAIKYNFV